jgi:hypothetical protein
MKRTVISDSSTVEFLLINLSRNNEGARCSVVKNSALLMNLSTFVHANCCHNCEHLRIIVYYCIAPHNLTPKALYIRMTILVLLSTEQ